MNRSITLVDAGYLLAAGGEVCTGLVTKRGDLDIDYAGLVRSLQSFTTNYGPSGRHLRTYWYDASPDSLPSPSHRDLDVQQRLRLRLGRLEQGRQKGVDALITKDMARFAVNPRVTALFLVSGDEDLLEAVADAMDAAVEVVVVTVPNAPNSLASSALVNVADVHLQLPGGYLRPYIRARATQTFFVPSPVADDESAETWADRGPVGYGYRFGVQFAQVNEVPAEVISTLPRLPPSIDGPLIIGASALKGAHLTDGERRELRGAFARGVLEQVHRGAVNVASDQS